ncbi:MAG TPA: EthD domain-containing protein [Acidimicrobiia bacterium]|nr:EthD domain-containing protein [Acidimicrobiia bacterium]
MEHMLVALWAPSSVNTASLLDSWVPIALADDSVRTCTISFADADQGRFPGPPCDALIALGLARAQDLDDLPARHELYAVAREVNVFRVDPRRVLTWDRTWPDGEYAPGIKYVSFVRRAQELSHGQFVRHWTETHAPLAREHHVGLADYTQNIVRSAFTPGGAGIDGIAELRFRTRADFEERFYDSDAGKAIIRDDVKRFIGRSGISPTLMRELPLRTVPS